MFNGSILNTTNAFYEMDKAAYAGDTMALATLSGAILSLIQNGIIGVSYLFFSYSVTIIGRITPFPFSYGEIFYWFILIRQGIILRYWSL